MTNDDREYWNGLAITVGAAAGLCAALLLCGCSTIRTLPGIGAALTPAWDEATLEAAQGVILTAPDGGRWRIKVGNDGTLSTEAAE